MSNQMEPLQCRWGLKVLSLESSIYACQYDNNWYFCVANYVSSEHGNVNMKFLHPKGPPEKFFLQQHDNVCWILIKDVYCEVDAP